MTRRISPLVADWKAAHKPNTFVTYQDALAAICCTCDRLHGTRLLDTIPRVPPTQLRTLTATAAEFNTLLRHAKPWMQALLRLTRTLGLRHKEAHLP